jgi:hypothetical protein
VLEALVRERITDYLILKEAKADAADPRLNATATLDCLLPPEETGMKSNMRGDPAHCEQQHNAGEVMAAIL